MRFDDLDWDALRKVWNEDLWQYAEAKTQGQNMQDWILRVKAQLRLERKDREWQRSNRCTATGILLTNGVEPAWRWMQWPDGPTRASGVLTGITE